MPDSPELAVHPVADLFPMLADDELAELAEDIKQRGLLQPIVLDAEGRVLDGRNRLAACELAGVEPRFVAYDGDDPDGYAAAVNLTRRHLNKGQRAMLAVRAGLLFKNSQTDVAADLDISQSRIAYASTIQAHAPALGDLVIRDKMSLNDAYTEARERKKIADVVAIERQWLVDRHPAIFDRLERGALTHPEAVTLGRAAEEEVRREEEERQRQERSKLDEAERQRQLAREEELAAVDRDRERIVRVISGWSSFRDLLLNEPTTDRARAVWEALGEENRASAQAILEQIGA
jgi:hypothetical protein